MNLTEEEKRILGFLPADEKVEKETAPIKMPSTYELEYGTVEADGEASFKAALEQTESEGDGMKFGNPTDFAEQFNNTMISVAGFPVDVATWATNRVAQVLFPNTYNAEEPFIDPETAIGGSSNLKSVLNPLGIGSDRQADTYMGYFGNTTGEAVTFLMGGAGVVQKTKNLNGFIGAISRSADDALRTKLGTVVGGEMAVSAGAAGGRQISEENEFGTTGAFVTEFATGAIALLSAGGVKKLAVDPLVQKLRDTKPEDLLTTLSKEEIEKVRDAGRKTIEENEPTPAPKEEPSLEQIQIEEEAARQRGRDNPTPIEPEAQKTPVEAPTTPAEPTPAPKAPEDAPEAAPKTDAEIDAMSDDELLTELGVDKPKEGVPEGSFRSELDDNIYTKKAELEDGVSIESGRIADDGDLNNLPEGLRKVLEPFKDNIVRLNVTIGKNGIGLDTIVVQKSSRGKGVGTQIINDIIAYADSQNLPIVLTPSNKNAAKLDDYYKRLGFVDNKDGLGKQKLIRKPTTPKTPMQQLVADYEKTIADQARGEGADSVVRLNAAFNAASDDFTKRVDALIADPNPENVGAVTEILDDYILLDGLDADLKQKTGQMLNAQRRDAADNVYTREMAENRQTRQDALKDVREKLQALKADANGEELQKLVDSVFEPPAPVKPSKTKNVASPDEDFMPTPKDVDESVVSTPKDTDGTPSVKREKDTKPAKPKLTPKERAIERLQKRLDELRAIRSGEKDPKEPKPKRAKSAEEKDLEARIAFYRGEAKEVDEIAATMERIQVLSGLLQGGTTAEIRAQIGLPPALRPSHAKPKKIQSQLTKLKKAEAALLKKLRRRQTDEILNDMRDVFDPENGRRSLVDQALNKYLLERTDALLNQPSTMTTGLPSGILQVIYRPLAATGKSTVKALNPADRELKGVGMTARMKYAAADAIATADQLLHLATHPKEIAKQLGRNLVDTAKAGGQSAYYYKDGNKMDVNLQGAAVGNSTIRNERQVRQAALRVAANKQKNLLVRKALETLGSDPMTTMFVIAKALRSAGRVGVGTADEPFILILEGRKHRADAIRAAIKEQIPKEDVATFIDDYVSKSSQIDNRGVQRFNYLDDKYRNAANEHRRALFRRGDFEGDDPRMLMEERFAQFWNRATGGDLTLGKFFVRFLQPIITTPTIALAQAGRGIARVTGIPAAVNVSQRTYAGVAKRIGKDGKISNVLSGRINNEINDLEIKVNELRAKTKEKGLDPEELERRKLDLAAHNSKLDSLRSYRDEQTYEEIAHMALAMGIFYTFYELGKNGLATGSGAFLTREQRNNGEFKKYRMLADEDSEGMSYLLADPFRTLAAVAADLGTWSQLEGSTTNKQTVGNFITSTLEAYATDSVFSTSLRHLRDLAFGQEKSRVGALIDMGASAIPVPSFIRGARTLDDEFSSVYDEGATVDEIPSRMLDKALGTPAENFRMDKLGRPLLRPQRGALNYVFRYAPEERANRMATEEEVNRILRNDGQSFNLIPKLTEDKTIKGTPINLKQFTNGERSLFNLFGEIVNENDDMLHEIGDMINTDDWRADYNDYTVEPDPDNPDEYYNKGIDRIKEIRSKYIKKAVERISDESSEAQLYRNKDGQTIFEYIEHVEARPPAQGNVLEKTNQF